MIKYSKTRSFLSGFKESDATVAKESAILPSMEKTGTDHLQNAFFGQCHPHCPGCAHRWMRLPESLGQKEKWLKKRLSAWADQIAPVRRPDDDHLFHYRTKVCLSAEWDANGWQFGLVHRDRVIDLRDCPVHSPEINAAARLLKESLPCAEAFPLVYYVQSGAQATLVVKQKNIPDPSWLTTDLTAKLEKTGMEGLWLHLNPGAGKNVFAKNFWRLLWGTQRSTDASGFIYGPRSFQQLIPQLFQEAMDCAEAFLSPRPKDLLVDLYCGTGIGLKRWTDRGCKVMGVELDGEAVTCAGANAPLAALLRGKCKDRIPQLDRWASAPPLKAGRLAFVNPPRIGLEPEVIHWLAQEYRPARIAYLSCSAGTLCRDLERLESHGYETRCIIPFDFFPWTYHVECLALVALKNIAEYAFYSRRQ